MKRVAVVVPLREGARVTARVLIEQGPPVDLEGTGLDRHEVFLTEREAIFLFEGVEPRAAVERLIGDAAVWRAAVAWRDVLGDKPRIADDVYAWDREPRPLHQPGL
jgi:hypothetical protein